MAADDKISDKVAFVSGLTGANLKEIYILSLAQLCGIAARFIVLLASPTVRNWHQRNPM
jgi:hypothetical protein